MTGFEPRALGNGSDRLPTEPQPLPSVAHIKKLIWRLNLYLWLAAYFIK